MGDRINLTGRSINTRLSNVKSCNYSPANGDVNSNKETGATFIIQHWSVPSAPVPRVLIVNRAHQLQFISGFSSFQGTEDDIYPKRFLGLFMLCFMHFLNCFSSIALKLHVKSFFCVGTRAAIWRSFKLLCYPGGRVIWICIVYLWVF